MAKQLAVAVEAAYPGAWCWLEGEGGGTLCVSFGIHVRKWYFHNLPLWLAERCLLEEVGRWFKGLPY